MDFSSLNRRPNLSSYGRRGNNSTNSKTARVIANPTLRTSPSSPPHLTSSQDQDDLDQNSIEKQSQFKQSRSNLKGKRKAESDPQKERVQGRKNNGKATQRESSVNHATIDEEMVDTSLLVLSRKGKQKKVEVEVEEEVPTSSPSELQPLPRRTRARRNPTPPRSTDSNPSTDAHDSDQIHSNGPSRSKSGRTVSSSRSNSGLQEDTNLRTSSFTSNASGPSRQKEIGVSSQKVASASTISSSNPKKNGIQSTSPTSKKTSSRIKSNVQSPDSPSAKPSKARSSTPTLSSGPTSPFKSARRSGGRSEDDRLGSSTPTPSRAPKDLSGLFELVSPSNEGASGSRAIRTLRNGRIRARSGSPTPSKKFTKGIDLEAESQPSLGSEDNAESSRKASLASRMAGKKKIAFDLGIGRERGGSASGSSDVESVSRFQEQASDSEMLDDFNPKSSRNVEKAGQTYGSGRGTKATYGSKSSIKTSSFSRSNLGSRHDDGSFSQPLNDELDSQDDDLLEQFDSPPRKQCNGSESSAPPTPKSGWRTAASTSNPIVHAASRALGVSAPTVPGARKTYGMQRSFLAEMEVDEDGEVGMKGVGKAVRNEAINSFPTNKMIGGKRKITELDEDGEDRSDDMDLDWEIPNDSSKEHHLPSNKNLLNPSNPLSRRSVGQKSSTGERLSYAEMRARYGDDEEVYVGYGSHSLLPPEKRSLKEDYYNSNGSQSQSQAMAVSSITSLRSAGELRRFNDELEYLLGGLGEDHSLSIKRSSAIQVVRKLCGDGNNPSSEDGQDEEGDENETLSSGLEFLRKLKASESITKVFDLFVNAALGNSDWISQPQQNITKEIAEDSILSVSLSMFLTLILQHQGIGESLLREREEQVFDCLYWLIRALEKGGNAADGLRKLNDRKKGKSLPKSERVSLACLRDLCISSIFPSSHSIPSQRSLLLRSICSLSSYPRRGDLSALERISSFDRIPEENDEERDSTLSLIVKLFCQESDKVGERLDAFTRGLDLIPSSNPSDGPDIAFIDLCSRLFEVCTSQVSETEIAHPLSSSSEAGDGRISTSRLATSLVTSLQVCQLLSKERAQDLRSSLTSPEEKQDDGLSELSTETLLGLLKILVNLTQVKTEEDFSTTFLTTKGSLNVLINLILISSLNLSRSDEVEENKLDQSNPSNAREQLQIASRNSIWLDDESDLSSLPPTSSPMSDLQRKSFSIRKSSPNSDSHSNPNSMEDISKKLSEQLALLLDVLCLSVGILTNLLESHPETASELLVDINLDPNCKRRSCVRFCNCLETPVKQPRKKSKGKEGGGSRASGSRSALEHLTNLFLDQKSRAEESMVEDENAREKEIRKSDSNFLSGCLAVVLSLAIFGNSKSKDVVGNTLSSSSEIDGNGFNSPRSPSRTPTKTKSKGKGKAKDSTIAQDGVEKTVAYPEIFKSLEDTLEDFSKLNRDAWKEAVEASKTFEQKQLDQGGETEGQTNEKEKAIRESGEADDEEEGEGDGLVNEMLKKIKRLCKGEIDNVEKERGSSSP